MASHAASSTLTQTTPPAALCTVIQAHKGLTHDVVVADDALSLLVQDLLPSATSGSRAGNALCPLPSSYGTVAIITDSNVWRLHGLRIQTAFKPLEAAGKAVHVKALQPGESSKTRAVKEEIEDWMLDKKCLRDTLVLAIGGGVVGDLAGFVAATYMRGVPVIQVPTTLLAMVDASIGGKTGLDVPAGKNLIGAFHQPLRVYADLQLLETLPLRELRNGFAEVIKAAAILDADLFAFLEEHAEALQGQEVDAGLEGRGGSAGLVPRPRLQFQDKSLLLHAVQRAMAIKAEVVAADPKEKAQRALLNFGHTVGHGLEAALQPAWLHGECVAVGMALEARAARALACRAAGTADSLSASSSSDCVSRLESLLRDFSLPTAPPDILFKPAEAGTAAAGAAGGVEATGGAAAGGSGTASPPAPLLLQSVLSFMSLDKKNSKADSGSSSSGSSSIAVRCVLLQEIGRTAETAPFTHPVPLSLLQRLLCRSVSLQVPVRPAMKRLLPELLAPSAAAVPIFPSSDWRSSASWIPVEVPGSKSISNRALLLAGLASGTTNLHGLLHSDDTRVMIEALQQLGATLRLPQPSAGTAGAGTVLVTGVGGQLGLGGSLQATASAATPASTAASTSATASPRTLSLYVGNAGTAARFLTAAITVLLSSAPPGSLCVQLRGVPRMHARPSAPLLACLRSLGAKITCLEKEGCLPILISGGLQLHDKLQVDEEGRTFLSVRLAAKLSSQYVSALLMAAPLFHMGLTCSSSSTTSSTTTSSSGSGNGDSTSSSAVQQPQLSYVRLQLEEEKPTSEPYIAMTCAVMRSFAVAVQRCSPSLYLVPQALQGYTPPQTVTTHTAAAAAAPTAASASATPPALPVGSYQVEPDASSAAYHAVLAATLLPQLDLRAASSAGDVAAVEAVDAGQASRQRTGVLLQGLGSKSTQGDAAVPLLLQRMGCRVMQEAEKTWLLGPDLAAGEGLQGLGAGEGEGREEDGKEGLDMAEQTDSFMALAAAAALAKGPTIITGIANQRVKECDRIAATVAELQRLGIAAEEREGGLKIQGSGLLGPGSRHRSETERWSPSAGAAAAGAAGSAALPPPLVACYEDHRMAMSFACLLAAKTACADVAAASPPAGAAKQGVILDSACVAKTYPEFWDHLEGYYGLQVQGELLALQEEEGGETVQAGQKEKKEKKEKEISPLSPPPSPPSLPPVIVLIGIRGAGKSWLGKQLAQQLSAAAPLQLPSAESGAGKRTPSQWQWQWLDCDRVLEEECGCSISQLVAEKGWPHMRAMEAAILERLLRRGGAASSSAGLVISCGGGVVETASSITLLQQLWQQGRGAVIHIDRSCKDIEEELQQADKKEATKAAGGAAAAATAAAGVPAGHRPAYAAGEPFSAVHSRRQPLYASARSHLLHVEEGDRQWECLASDLLCIAQAALRQPVLDFSGAPVVSDGRPAVQWAPSSTFLCLALEDPSCLLQLQEDVLLGHDAVELRADTLKDGSQRGISAAIAAVRRSWSSRQLAARRAMRARAGDSSSTSIDAAEEAGSSSISWWASGCRMPALLFTLRSQREGGKFPLTAGSLAEEQLLAYSASCQHALSLGADMLDLELCALQQLLSGAPEEGAKLLKALQLYQPKLVLSRHWLSQEEAGKDLVSTVAACSALLQGVLVPSASYWQHPSSLVLKLVAPAAGSAEGALAWQSQARAALKAAFPQHATIVVCTGPEGACTRLLNQHLTPVMHPALPGPPAAPGQLSLAALRQHQAGLGLLPAQRFALFGSPISKSLSPLIHSSLFKALGLDSCCSYSLAETSSAEEAVAALRSGSLAAANITIPLKEAVLPACTSLSPAALAIGAVNVVLCKQARGTWGSGGGTSLHGINTDWLGIARPVQAALAAKAFAGRKGTAGREGKAGAAAAIVVGAGGTARAAAFAMTALGLKVLLHNPRTPDKADVLAADLSKRAGWEGASVQALAKLEECSDSTTVLISTLPGTAEWLPPAGWLERLQPVTLDVCYSPRATKLLQRAVAAGCTVVDGLQMLVDQAEAAAVGWLGKGEPTISHFSSLPGRQVLQALIDSKRG